MYRPRLLQRARLLPGTLDLLILCVLQTGPLCDKEIRRELAQRTRGVIRPGTGSMVPALKRLHARGYLQLEPGKSKTGRPAKLYQLKAAGTAHLHAQRKAWDRLAPAIDQVLKSVFEEQQAKRRPGRSENQPPGPASPSTRFKDLEAAERTWRSMRNRMFDDE
jgi:DNA-binding PadR family transcriptional regulator